MINLIPKPTGVLLAGGKSSRMQNALSSDILNKSLITLGSKPLLLHVLDKIRDQADPIIINTNLNSERFLSFGLPIVPDTIEDFSGPLAGILAGMNWATMKEPNCKYIFSVSTDVPFIPSDLVKTLQAYVEEGSETTILARSNGQIHPVIGLWPTSHRNLLENALKRGVRKVLNWTTSQKTVYVDIPMIEINGEIVDPFFNINTPSDLEKARRLIGL